MNGNQTTIQNFWALYNNTLTQDNLLGVYENDLIKTNFSFDWIQNSVNVGYTIDLALKQNKYYINSIMNSEGVPAELLNVSGTYVWNGYGWYCSETDFYITRHEVR